MYKDSIARIQCNVLQIIRILTFGDDGMRSSLISKTNLMDHLGALLSKDVPSSLPSTLDPIVLACRVLGDLVSGFYEENTYILSRFLTDSNMATQLLKTCLKLIKSRQDIHARRAGCYLVARLFALHFGEIVFLNLSAYLEMEMNENGRIEVLGVLYYRELVDILIENHDPLDLTLMESVRLSLQCLLGRCDFAKNDALNGNSFY
jgi:hypothetical protein